jgi:hypothetical protein
MKRQVAQYVFKNTAGLYLSSCTHSRYDLLTTTALTATAMLLLFTTATAASATADVRLPLYLTGTSSVALFNDI